MTFLGLNLALTINNLYIMYNTCDREKRFLYQNPNFIAFKHTVPPEEDT